jgi:hypothetical protein
MSTEVNLIDVIERLVRLEAEYSRLEGSQVAITIKLDAIIDKFTRYEARWGGIFMVVSALIGLLAAFHSAVLGYFRAR